MRAFSSLVCLTALVAAAACGRSKASSPDSRFEDEDETRLDAGEPAGANDAGQTEPARPFQRLPWAERVERLGATEDIIVAGKLDGSNENVFAAGQPTETRFPPRQGAYAARFGTDGSMRWTRSLGATDVPGSAVSWLRMAVAGDGVVLAGVFQGELAVDGSVDKLFCSNALSARCGFIVRYSADGRAEWALGFFVQDADKMMPVSAVADVVALSDGSVAAAGWFSSYSGGAQLAVRRGAEVETVFQQTLIQDEIFLLRVGVDGRFIWKTRIRGGDHAYHDGLNPRGAISLECSFTSEQCRLALTPEGRLVVSFPAGGLEPRTIWIGNDQGIFSVSTAGVQDFLALLDASNGAGLSARSTLAWCSKSSGSALMLNATLARRTGGLTHVHQLSGVAMAAGETLLEGPAGTSWVSLQDRDQDGMIDWSAALETFDSNLAPIGTPIVLQSRPDVDGTRAPAGRTQRLNPLFVRELSDGSSLVGGTFAGSIVLSAGRPDQLEVESPEYEMFLARYTADGSLLWFEHAASHQNGNAMNDLVELADGRLAAVGVFGSSSMWNSSAIGNVEIKDKGEPGFLLFMSKDGFPR